VSNEIKVENSLTPRHLAFLKKLRRMHDECLIERRNSVIFGVSFVLTVSLIALSIASLVGEWSPLSTWFLAFFAGMSELQFLMSLRHRRFWPAQARITDWKLLEEIVDAANNNSNPTR
jgi:hypothetical protein